jgi:NADH-quinone oxidoreductase subunit L
MARTPIMGTMHGHHHAHVPHESPWVMLVPLAVLSIGAIAAGFVFKEAFIGHNYESFWKTALFTGKDNHIIHDFHKVPKWVVWSPFVAMVHGLCRRVLLLCAEAPCARRDREAA